MTTESNLTFDVELPPEEKSGFMQAVFSYATLSSLLRIVGAGVLVASVSMFLFKGWGDGNDLQRYLMLLAHTLMLAVTGIIVGKWVKESKGARLFLGLSLISTVVNFSVLGGLIYSQLQWDGALLQYPSFATWQADTFTQAITTAAIAWCVLLPVAWFSFMALARRSALRLTGLFVLSSSTLLLPVRHTETIAIVVGALTLGLLLRIIKAKNDDPSLATFEGRFARLTVFAAPVILVGRGMYLYSLDVLMVTVLAGLVFVGLRQLVVNKEANRNFRQVLNAVSVLPALVMAYGVATTVTGSVWQMEMSWLPIFGLVLCGLLVDVSLRDLEGGMIYRRLASLVVVTAMLANLAIHPQAAAAIVCLVSGTVVMIYGYSFQQRIDFFAGTITLLAGVGYQCVLAFEAFDLGSWSALAIIGVLAIVAGSVLERHGAIIRARVSNWQQSFKKWQY